MSEPNPETGQQADGTADDPGRNARLWIKTLSEFVGKYLPAANEFHESDAIPDSRHVDPRVRYALHDAQIAALERIARICRADTDVAPLAPLGGLPTPSEN